MGDESYWNERQNRSKRAFDALWPWGVIGLSARTVSALLVREPCVKSLDLDRWILIYPLFLNLLLIVLSDAHRLRDANSLPVLFDQLSSDSVHVSAALAGQSLSQDDALLLVVEETPFINNFSGSKLLEAVADALTSWITLVLSLGSSALFATVVLAEGKDSETVSHVQLVSDRCSAGVEPVRIKGSQLMRARGLVVLSPL